MPDGLGTAPGRHRRCLRIGLVEVVAEVVARGLVEVAVAVGGGGDGGVALLPQAQGLGASRTGQTPRSCGRPVLGDVPAVAIACRVLGGEATLNVRRES